MANFGLFSVMAQTWHRLVLPFKVSDLRQVAVVVADCIKFAYCAAADFLAKAWPMQLGKLLDSNLNAAERSVVAEKFCNANTCCLDPYYSAKLRSFMQAGAVSRLSEVLQL